MLFLKLHVIIAQFWIICHLVIIMVTASSSSYASDIWYKFSTAGPKGGFKKYKLKCTPWRGTLQIYPYYLQRDKCHTTSHSDYFCQSRNSHCEMLQLLRIWEVSINRNNCEIRTDYWSKNKTLSLTECNATNTLRKQDTNVYFYHLGMHQDWNQVQKTCSQPVLQILVLQKQDQTLVPPQNLKVKRSTYFFF
jgi:hypothetical protein